MNPLLPFLLLLCSIHDVFASTPKNDDYDAYLSIQKIIDGEFSQVAALAERLFTSGHYDSVFRRLREGQSPVEDTRETIDIRSSVKPGPFKEQPSLGSAKSIFRPAFESFGLQNYNPVHHPRVLQRAPLPRHFQPVAHYQHPIFTSIMPTILAEMRPVYLPVCTTIKQHLAVLASRTLPRVFLIYSGTTSDFIQPKLCLITHIFNFFNLQADLNLPFYNASYLAIPSPYSTPRAVLHMARVAPSISTSFSLTALVQKLLLLNEALLDDRVFKEVIAIQIDFDTRSEVTISILFKDIRNSFETNHDFLQIALEKFTA